VDSGAAEMPERPSRRPWTGLVEQAGGGVELRAGPSLAELLPRDFLLCLVVFPLSTPLWHSERLAVLRSRDSWTQWNWTSKSKMFQTPRLPVGQSDLAVGQTDRAAAAATRRAPQLMTDCLVNGLSRNY